MRWTYFNVETGRIVKVETRPASNPPILKDAVEVVEGHFDEHLKWINNGEVKDRPATGLPKSHTLPRDTDWTVPDVPEGAEVVIDEHSAGTVDGDGLVLSFPEPGEYRVELRPPFPWRSATCEVTVQ